MRPFRQGDLDGLCGVYAVINSLELVGAPLRRGQLREVFQQLIYSLGAASLLEAMQTGMDALTLLRAVELTFGWLAATYDVRLEAGLPFEARRFRSAAGYLRALRDRWTRQAQPRSSPSRTATPRTGAWCGGWRAATCTCATPTDLACSARPGSPSTRGGGTSARPTPSSSSRRAEARCPGADPPNFRHGWSLDLPRRRGDNLPRASSTPALSGRMKASSGGS